MKSISIIKEKRMGEHRVILLPEQVKLFKNAGYDILVEEGAGSGIDVPDELYTAAGAKIVNTEQAWTNSKLILKYKPPIEDEMQFLNQHKIIGAVFHAEGDKKLTDALLRSRCTAYSYEFFKTPNGVFPLSVASSEIAGKAAVIYGAYHLQKHLGGSGVLLSYVPGVKPPKVVIIGYGNAGGSAARMAAQLGAEVVVLGTDRARLRKFQTTISSNVTCYLNSAEVIKREIANADLVIGAILISTYDTEPILTEDMVKIMKKGSVIVDVTCGYGSGYMPSFDHSTSLQNPVYEKFGVLHCKIDILPSAFPKTTVPAMSQVIAPYLLNLAEAIFKSKNDPTSEAGKIVETGRITHYELQRHYDRL